MAGIPEKIKDPNAELDFGVDWSDWLATGETISASTWTVPSGITKENDSKTDTVTTIWLSGGKAGRSYRIVNRITTSADRTDDRSIDIVVEER